MDAMMMTIDCIFFLLIGKRVSGSAMTYTALSCCCR